MATTSLEQFTLDFLAEHDALVERPRYGIAEVLLPEAEAQRLACDSYLRLAFSEEAARSDPDAVFVTISHPLVERMIEWARTEGQTTRWTVQAGRLRKPNLFAVIKETIFFPNAWLVEDEGAVAHPELHHYVRFNFKVAFISDEKQEEIVSQWMDLNRGIPAPGLDAPDTALMLSHDPPPQMPLAPLQWAPDLDPLGEKTLSQILARAAHAVTQRLTPRLEQIQRRSKRLLELDLARLRAFYDETETHLQRRLERTQDETRLETLRNKLAFAQADRERKLADVRQKYRLRISLDLLNVALAAQPKLVLRAGVENRYHKRPHHFVWDPVLHELEAPLCAVCQKPFRRLHLCANGHLMCDAHTHHCDMCKREFCGLCQESLAHCAACGRVICPSSQIRCKTCGDVYCADHQRHPHAAG